MQSAAIPLSFKIEITESSFFKSAISQINKLYQLTRFEIAVRYHDTKLGWTWAILKPLCLFLALNTVLGPNGLLTYRDGFHSIVVFAGILPWHFFSESFNRVARILPNKKEVLKKADFPLVFVPCSIIISILIEFFIGICVMLIACPLVGIQLSTHLFFLPLCMASILFSSLGIGLIFASISASLGDINQGIPFVLRTWFFLTPIAYPVKLISSKWLILYSLNPMVGVVEGLRWAVIGQNPASWTTVKCSFVSSIVLLIVGSIFFLIRKKEITFFLNSKSPYQILLEKTPLLHKPLKKTAPRSEPDLADDII